MMPRHRPQPVPEPQRRQPMWAALSELYLDVELQEEDFQRIAAVCAASKFTWAEIQQINYDEVAPVLWTNLLSAAGEWLGWDETALTAAITANYTGRPQRLFWARRLWRGIIDYFTAACLTRIAYYLA